MKIEIGKQYKTKSGLPVRILCTDRMTHYGTACVIALMILANEEVPAYYTLDGAHFPHDPLGDLVEVNEWDDLKVDDKVMVSSDGVKWYKRYFSGIRGDGEPMVFKGGMTSWTADASETSTWKYCRLPTEDELK